MARLKIRVRFNPGREGSPMDKLGEFSSQWEKFLRSLTNDLGIVAKKGEWLAKNFGNESVSWDGEFAGNVPDEVAVKGRRVFEMIGSDTPLEACNKGMIGYGTMAEYSRLSKTLDPDEKFYFGVYQNGEDRPDQDHWHEVSYSKISGIRQLLDAPFITYGSLQGVLYDWAFGAKIPFFQIRELSKAALVKCTYDVHNLKLYNLIHAATKKQHTTIHVYGDIKWDKPTNNIIEMFTKNIEVSESLSETDFYNLFGSMPGFTGDLSTSDYIDWLRGDGE